MQNVAGLPAPEADPILRAELLAAGISEEPATASAEVFSTVGGRLGHFTFRRLWYYWSVNGYLPLAVARTLYADPAGRRDVRVRGDCTAPAPGERRTALWLTETGREILDRDNEAEARTFARSNSATMAGIARAMLDRCVFADDPAQHPGAEGYITAYHIDSADGLRLFADAVRAAGLESDPLTGAHARVHLYHQARAERCG